MAPPRTRARRKASGTHLGVAPGVPPCADSTRRVLDAEGVAAPGVAPTAAALRLAAGLVRAEGVGMGERAV